MTVQFGGAPAKAHILADIAIIGAGSGGLVAASGAAQLGLKVELFEKGEMGGDCLNYGCVPSKALIAAARAAAAGRTASRFGISFPEPQIDWARVTAHVRGVIDTIAPIDSQERFEKMGVKVVREAAWFVDAKTVASESISVRARHIVIATGAESTIPAIPGLASAPYLTNETIFSLSERPKRLLVLGGGAIGLELGQAFRQLGSEVVIIEADLIMGGGDFELIEPLRRRLELDGVSFRERSKVNAVGLRSDGQIEMKIAGPGGDETLVGSKLLVATGRRPALEGLALGRAGISFDARGVRTNAFMRASNRRVWALGDVAGREQFTHVAGFHGGLFIRNALFRLAPGRVDSAPIPKVVYTTPEIAQVGVNEQQARARYGDKARVVRSTFEENDRAQTERACEGLVKIVVAPNGRILGAAMVGEGAGDVIATIGLAISSKLKIGALTSGFVPPYPTRAETLKRAAGQFFSGALFSARMRMLVWATSRLP